MAFHLRHPRLNLRVLTVFALVAIPLAAIGAFGLLWLLDFGGKAGLYPPIPAMNINLFSLVGLVLLIGLVTKNAILLVDFAMRARAQGLEREQVRSIISTSLVLASPPTTSLSQATPASPKPGPRPPTPRCARRWCRSRRHGSASTTAR